MFLFIVTKGNNLWLCYSLLQN